MCHNVQLRLSFPVLLVDYEQHNYYSSKCVVPKCIINMHTMQVPFVKHVACMGG